MWLKNKVTLLFFPLFDPRVCVLAHHECQPNLTLEEGSIPSRGPSDLQLWNVLPPHVFIGEVIFK